MQTLEQMETPFLLNLIIFSSTQKPVTLFEIWFEIKLDYLRMLTFYILQDGELV